MGRIKRFITAPLRLRTSRGFGVHSPFAFSFIINVLKQHDSFYSYSTQNSRTIAARNYARSLPTKSLQHLIFRICNRFRPNVVFELGHSSGLEAMAVLDYSSNCRLMSYDNRQPSDLFINVTERSKDRITIVPNFRIGVEQYNLLTANSTPLVVVNRAQNNDTDRDFILSVLNRDGVALFTDIQHDSITNSLWEEINDQLETHGMTFTNDRRGVIVGNTKLPRQCYRLWL
ncbi:MAG: hypothetical protein K2K88_02795 [Muribaculaceae bacterium]|nr:hypothetical protein [Muribaculaceae bacterium]MDE6352057.1 hypothetical protein [Muribaculaceae bacterium]MDE6644413.1 hypothetical protein [Muribaculaceae bacterium]